VLKRILLVLIVAVILAAAALPQSAVYSQSTPQVSVHSSYVLNRYGFATDTVTVKVKNNGTGAIKATGSGGIEIGFGSILTSLIVDANLTSGYNWSNSSSNGNFLITGGGTVPAGNSTSFALTVLFSDVVSQASNGTLQVVVLASPYVSTKLTALSSIIQMPTSTTLAFAPRGFAQTYTGTNATYSRTQDNLTTTSASDLLCMIEQYSLQDLHPLVVYSASRVISFGTGGTPQVQDTISFENLGTTEIQTLYVTPLAPSDASITVEPAGEPPLLNPASVSLTNFGIDLTTAQGENPVPVGGNYTIVYQYPLDQKYFKVSGDSVSLQIPRAPPIRTYVKSYTIRLSLPEGTKAVWSGPVGVTLTAKSPFDVRYTLPIGWALNAGVPGASVLFVVLLLGLFISRTTTTEEEETEEETATERASAMIKAFEDKTSLINQLLAEIPNADPSERDKAYFDELRGRLDAYRSRALQRLNEVKQKSTTQKFFDLLNQLHTTEREVDRAAKDTLNLYEQYYTNRMRKEVFDRLLPSYRKRLEKALDQLSEELHGAQREAKLL
jgi:hypothetical protein